MAYYIFENIFFLDQYSIYMVMLLILESYISLFTVVFIGFLFAKNALSLHQLCMNNLCQEVHVTGFACIASIVAIRIVYLDSAVK